MSSSAKTTIAMKIAKTVTVSAIAGCPYGIVSGVMLIAGLGVFCVSASLSSSISFSS